MRRFPTIALATALLAAACSHNPGPDVAAVAAADVIARVDGAVGTGDSEAVAVQEGCHTEIVTDEYGFEVEVVVCDDEPTTTTSSIPATDLVSWLESPDAREVANTLYDIVILQAACTKPDKITRLASLAEAAPDVIGAPLDAAVTNLYRMAAACNVDDAEWQQALEDALDDLDTLAAILRGAPNA